MVKPVLFETKLGEDDHLSSAANSSPESSPEKAAKATGYAAASPEKEEPADDDSNAASSPENTPKKQEYIKDEELEVEATEKAPVEEEDDSDTEEHKPPKTRTEAEWNAMLFSLLLFKSRWGDLNIPPNDADHTALYEWVQDQRAQYKVYQEKDGDPEDPEDAPDNPGGLNPDRIAVLDTIGFTWNIRGDVFWQKHFESLVAYKKENGDVKVPRLYIKNPKLGECEFIHEFMCIYIFH